MSTSKLIPLSDAIGRFVPDGSSVAAGLGLEGSIPFAAGHEIMRHIAELIPPEKRGHYSDNPVIREAAKGTEIYPWANKVEGEVVGEAR